MIFAISPICYEILSNLLKNNNSMIDCKDFRLARQHGKIRRLRGTIMKFTVFSTESCVKVYEREV